MNLSGIFNKISPKKALVIGDFMLDTYTLGQAGRISPEAPVAVVKVESVQQRPGGAGNVVLNLRSLGMEVAAVGRLGSDDSGEKLLDSLKEEGVLVDGCVVQSCYKTPVKNRIIAANQQMVRIDYEEDALLPEQMEQQVIEALPKLLDDVSVVAISDYGKGFLTDTLLAELIGLARRLGIPVIADPKGIDFSKYAGSTLIKPNFSEAVAVSGLDARADLDLIAKNVLSSSKCDRLIITRSEKGLSLFDKEGNRQDFPVAIRKVKDVTGAGDTVLAVITFILANGLPLSDACRMANIAAGLAVEELGCARITLQALAKRLLEEDVENKVFDDQHIYALKEVLNGRDVVLLGIDEGTEVSADLLKSIRSCKQGGRDLILYLRDKDPCPELIHILTTLKEVDYLIHHGESFRKLCRMIHPSLVYIFGKGKLQTIEEPALLM